MGGELVNIDAAVAKDAGVPVDPADTGSSGYDAFKAFRRRNGGGHVVPRLLQVGPAVRGHSLHQHTGRNSLLYRIFRGVSNLQRKPQLRDLSRMWNFAGAPAICLARRKRKLSFCTLGMSKPSSDR